MAKKEWKFRTNLWTNARNGALGVLFLDIVTRPFVEGGLIEAIKLGISIPF